MWFWRGLATTNSHSAVSRVSVNELAANPSPTRFYLRPAFATATLALLPVLLISSHSVSGLSSSCADGGAVADAANNPELVSDCDALLAARDTLAGSATLNWAANGPIREWEDVRQLGMANLRWLFVSSDGMTGWIVEKGLTS